jgi:hypothetical protein
MRAPSSNSCSSEPFMRIMQYADSSKRADGLPYEIVLWQIQTHGNIRMNLPTKARSACWYLTMASR